MKLYQHRIQLQQRSRGFHVVTDEIINSIPQINGIKMGMCNVFIQHTSASLLLNEDADPAVRKDFEMYFNKIVPENDPGYVHDDEGSDDMPAHLKSALLGSSVIIPVIDGKLALGRWQGIYLCEHRNNVRRRNLIVTIWGE
jgi:secondary thiamine-phosphate synthase enzyme